MSDANRDQLDDAVAHQAEIKAELGGIRRVMNLIAYSMLAIAASAVWFVLTQ